MPFKEAKIDDPLYQLIAGNRSSYFWKKFKQHATLSEELKDLLTSMFQLNTSARYTLDEIMVHPWLDGPVPSQTQIIAEFRARLTSTTSFAKYDNKD